MLFVKAGWRTRPSVGTQGIVMIGVPSPICSHKIPRASVSVMPCAHLLIVLKVAGATTMALALGMLSGSVGCLYSLRIGWPVSFSSKGISIKCVPFECFAVLPRLHRLCSRTCLIDAGAICVRGGLNCLSLDHSYHILCSTAPARHRNPVSSGAS